MSDVKLKQLFAKTFQISTDDVVDTLEYRSIPLWDSIGHMSLIAGIDDEFDVMLDTDDIIDLSSFKQAKNILSKYGVHFE